MSKSDTLFLTVVATIPIQLNKFFFANFSYVLGIPSDYRAITIYLSDLVIIAYILLSLSQNRSNLFNLFKLSPHFFAVLSVFNIYIFLADLLFSSSKLASFWSDLKTLEFSLLTFFAASTLSKKSIIKPAVAVLTISLLWQSVLVILQFTFQRSLNLWILGERAFDASTISIATTNILGSNLLRPYGTFPHPNVAAAFLLITGLITLSFLSSSKIKKTQSKHLILCIITALSIVLTFSKSALITFLASFLILTKNPKQLFYAIITLSIPALFFFKYLLEFQIASISERITLSQAALEITLKNPIFGIGSHNFTKELANLDLISHAQIRLIQPVHNVFLLILSENGIIGLLLFVAILLTVFKYANSKYKLTLFIALLIFASLDHFLWTLHQGQLLFWLTLAYILSQPPPKSLAR